MSIKCYAKKIGKYIPGIKIFVDHPEKTMEIGAAKRKILRNSLYLGGVAIAFTCWGIGYLLTGELKPRRQIQVSLENSRENKKRERGLAKLFSKEGLADTNKNGLDLSEVSEAFSRIRDGQKVHFSKIYPPSLSINLSEIPSASLEQAIKSYESEGENRR